MRALLAGFGTEFRHRLLDLNQEVRAGGAAQRHRGAGEVPPLCISANIPGGDACNGAAQAQYGERIAGLA